MSANIQGGGWGSRPQRTPGGGGSRPYWTPDTFVNYAIFFYIVLTNCRDVQPFEKVEKESKIPPPYSNMHIINFVCCVEHGRKIPPPLPQNANCNLFFIWVLFRFSLYWEGIFSQTIFSSSLISHASLFAHFFIFRRVPQYIFSYFFSNVLGHP